MTQLPKLGLLVATVLFAVACGNRSSDSKDNEDESSDPTDRPACTTTAECPDGGVCRDEVCLVPTSCTSDDDCGINSECDVEASVCVECLVGAHCAEDETCMGKVCRSECEESQDCSGDLKCAENGYCAECLGDSDCPSDEHCEDSVCRPDACQARSTTCGDDGSVLVCSERGDSEVQLKCPDGEACGSEQGPAWCQGWICVPGQAFCAEGGNIAHTCSSDGLTLAETTDCSDSNSLCFEGACAPVICDSYDSYCKDGNVYTCDSLGIAEQVSTVCGISQYCDETDASCKLQVCEPETQGCSDGEVGTCNELGSAYEDLVACEIDEACSGGECEPIVCNAGSRFCQGQVVRQCDNLGIGSSSYLSCSAGQFCNEVGSNAYCSTDVCVPGQPTCEGDIQGTCNAEGSGLQGSSTTDCALSDQACVAGACAEVICEFNTRLCVGGDVHQCVSKGSSTQLYDNCTSTEYCDSVTATCKTQICTPGLPGCDGQVGRVCNADGSGWTEGGTDCAALTDKACVSGVCQDVICPAGGRYCEGTQVMSCNATGTAGSVYSSCSLSTHCYESSPTTASCRTDVCTANAAYCSGQTASVCASDGSGPLPGGTLCTDSDLSCYAGACAEVVCTGSYECVNGDYHRCTNNQTATSLFDDCSGSEYCSETLGCRPQVCTPSALTCQSATWLRTCNLDGSGFTDTACALGSQACWNGVCEPLICDSGETTCVDGDYHFCTENGTDTALLNHCVQAQYCDPESGCLPDVCDANEPTCNGDVVTVCNGDGSAPLPGGTDCSSTGEACYNAECLPMVCEDGAYQCDGDQLSQCVNNGTNVALIQTCEIGTHCSEAEGTCLQDVCAVGQTVCDGFASVLTCSADLEGFDFPGTACDTDEVCVDGACIDEGSACTIAGKTWSTPELISAKFGQTRAAADPQGNIVVAWSANDGVYGAYYSSTDDAWTVEAVVTQVDSSGPLDVSVSADGTAMVVYKYLTEDFIDQLAWSRFNPGTRTWTEPAIFSSLPYLDPYWDEITLAADAQGRFAISHCGYSGVRAAHFSLGDHWSDFQKFSTQDTGGCALDMTAGGRIALGWIEGGAANGAKWTSFDFETGAWATSQRVEGPVSYPMSIYIDVMFGDETGTDLWFLYGAGSIGDQLHVNRWTASGGLETPVTLHEEAYYGDGARGQRLTKTPDGDIFAFGGGLVLGHLPAGSGSWALAGGINPISGIVTFPGNDLITGYNYIHTYLDESGWSSPVNTGVYEARLVGLPGCEAARIYSTNAGIYITRLQ